MSSLRRCGTRPPSPTVARSRRSRLRLDRRSPRIRSASRPGRPAPGDGPAQTGVIVTISVVGAARRPASRVTLGIPFRNRDGEPGVRVRPSGAGGRRRRRAPGRGRSRPSTRRRPACHRRRRPTRDARHRSFRWCRGSGGVAGASDGRPTSAGTAIESRPQRSLGASRLSGCGRRPAAVPATAATTSASASGRHVAVHQPERLAVVGADADLQADADRSRRSTHGAAHLEPDGPRRRARRARSRASRRPPRSTRRGRASSGSTAAGPAERVGDRPACSDRSATCQTVGGSANSRGPAGEEPGGLLGDAR